MWAKSVLDPSPYFALRSTIVDDLMYAHTPVTEPVSIGPQSLDVDVRAATGLRLLRCFCGRLHEDAYATSLKR